jgi:hypothetical protein
MRGISSVFRRLSRRAPKLGRALVCAAVIASAAGYGSLRVARAEVGERLLGFGAELASLPSMRAHGPPRRLSVNGLEFGLLTLSTTEPVRETLDRFHERCRARGGFSLPEALSGKLGSLDGTLRLESEQEGVIACIDTDRPLAFEELSRRLTAFGKSGDLKDIGELRYAFVRREGARTTVVSLWTEGSAPLFGAFPEKGDAPGFDPRDVPRPPSSRRLLSGKEHGMPYSLTLYRVEQAPESLRAWYERAFAAGGWEVVAKEAHGPVLLRKGERTLSLQVSLAREGQSVAAIAELS